MHRKLPDLRGWPHKREEIDAYIVKVVSAPSFPSTPSPDPDPYEMLMAERDFHADVERIRRDYGISCDDGSDESEAQG